MSEQEMIRPGQAVVSSDGVPMGTVERFDGTTVHIDGWDIPAAAIARIEGGVVFLHLARADFATSGDDTAADQLAAREALPHAGTEAQAERLVIPLAEERLQVGTREVALGEVEIRKRVVVEERQVPVVARREELIILRREPGQSWSADITPGPNDEVTNIALHGWEPTVSVEAIVGREVAIERTRIAEEGHIAATVRREHVEVTEEHREGADHGEGTPAAAPRLFSGSTGWDALRRQIREASAVDDQGQTENEAPVERMVVPLAEERAVVGGQETDLGEVRLIRRVIEEPRTIPLTIRREEIEVVRRGPDGHEVVELLRPNARRT